MAPPAKKSKSSTLLLLLILAVVLILICSAGIGFLVYRNQQPSLSPNATSLPLFLDPKSMLRPAHEAVIGDVIADGTTTTTTVASTTRTTTQKKKDESTTTLHPTETSATETTTAAQDSDDDVTATAVVEPTTQPDETSTQEIHMPVDTQSVVGKEQNEMVAQCSAIIAESVSCHKSTEDISVLSASSLRPLHYSLNLTIRTVQPTVIIGKAAIYFQMTEAGKQISLNAASALRGLEQVSVVDCTNGKTLCIAKTVFQPREEVLSFLLSDTVTAGTNLRINFDEFTSVENREAVYSLVPPRWHRGAPTIVGTVFGASTARKIFPAFDQPMYKAPLELCVRHSSGLRVRSNADAINSTTEETCFAPTLPLSTEQYSFAAFEKAETLITNSTTVDGAFIPSVEMVFSINKNFKREKHSWIYNEASKVIAMMSSWSGFSYPLSKLSLFSSPIPMAAHSALGIITLQDRLVEYPSYTLAHVSLIRAVIGQWLGGIVGGPAEQHCFQDSLTTYLEWKLNENYGFVNRSRAAEVTATRPRDLAKDGMDDSRMMRSPQGSPACSARFVAIFYSLDETYGQNTTTNMIKEIFNRFAFSVASMDDWKNAVVAATGNEDAGVMLSEWFARTTRPVLRAVIRSQSIELEQLTADPWTVPIEIGGSAGVQRVTVDQPKQTVAFSSDDYVILDPARKSTAIVVYDADAYLRLVRCWDASSCPAPRPSLQSAVRDMGAAMLADKLPEPEETDIAKWKQFFTFVSDHRLIDGDASCCVSYALRQPADNVCTWVVQDTCQKIRLAQYIAAH